jgi:hypothetical protein
MSAGLHDITSQEALTFIVAASPISYFMLRFIMYFSCLLKFVRIRKRVENVKRL